jgi:NADPH:quinone reductase-like Zn-dependent oxidoreductase
MKAVRFHRFGGPDVLQLDELDDLRPGPGEVLLRVHACSLNHLDVDIRAGVSRFAIELPHTVGYELVGTVAALGKQVTGWRVGERVAPYFCTTCGTCTYCRGGQEPLCSGMQFLSFATPGGCAELTTCSPSQLVRVPADLSDVAAAAVQVAFSTSWHMLFDRARLRAGETILVDSVGSGIGSAAVQLAKLAGAFVIGTASSDEKLGHARALGMDVGINYTRDDVVAEVMRLTAGVGVDVAYEHVGGALFQAALDSVATDGRLVTCGAHGGEVVPFDIIPFFRSQKTVLGSFCFTRDEFERCLRLAARGWIKPVVARTFPLEEAQAAMETMESRQAFGKIVIEPA